MQIKIFTIPITDNGQFLEEMNRFLRGNKILEIENNFMQNEHGACWCFCVKYIESLQYIETKKEKTDYRQVLDEATFKKFSRLREIRKQIALDEAVPAFAVFTDEELAGLAKLDSLTAAAMQTVKGIGEKKTERYAERFISMYEQKKADDKKVHISEQNKINEKSGLFD